MLLQPGMAALPGGYTDSKRASEAADTGVSQVGGRF